MPLRIPKLKVWQWAVLALGLCAVAAGGIQLLKVLPIHDIIQRIGELGPVPFFFALAILPGVGAPITPFYLLAGASFGMKTAIPLVIAGVSANLAFSYVMARWIVRPLVEWIVRRLGYKIPVVKPEDRWAVTLLLRITPGPPLVVQNYVLGLAGVPFGIYMVVSVLVVSFFAVGMTIFGQSIMYGKSGLFVIGGCLVVAALIGMRLGRNMMQRRAAAVAAAAVSPGERPVDAAAQ